ncbi:MAG TPA: RNA polymerase factor sigma-54 [Thermoanaerobaculia bacterium]|nr:RNA polymerase factor sigma-54 [Thermoanaerobaculia bacterium]
MALEQKLSLKLSQKLVMTPSLQQAIKLLQMTRMELEGVITQEMMENPTLEEAQLEPVAEEKPAEEPEREERTDELDHEESMADIDLDEFFGDYMESSGYASVREHREAPPLENTLSRDPDLYDHLLWQLHMSDAPVRLREIAELIIGNLDPQGFLVADLEEIRALGDQLGDELNGNGSHLPYTSEEVEVALDLVRRFDPPGIAYASLRESLISQLERAGIADRVDELAHRILCDHWDLFLRRQYATVAKKLGLELADLESAVERIKTLETRPGRGFATDRTHYIEPDVYVLKVGQDWVIQINDDGMPRLRVSKAYRRMLATMRKEGHQAEAQQFIKEKIRSAVWLIKSIDQRQRTIHKVANSIVHQQQEFLEHGVERLRPMVLRDVAEDIGMHESTVSRVVSNKYIHTPRGVLPMKYFFHSGIDREYGEEISSLSVKKKIQEMIDQEDSKNPLSDSELMRMLNREGIQIARRTVAKYRDELNIASSTERKQIF